MISNMFPYLSALKIWDQLDEAQSDIQGYSTASWKVFPRLPFSDEAL